MLWGMRAFMFLAYLSLGGLLALAVSRFLTRKWNAGLKAAGLALATFVFSSIAMGLWGVAYATSVSDGRSLDPADKARFLGEAIATQMNYAALGLPIGVVIIAIVQLRTTRRP